MSVIYQHRQDVIKGEILFVEGGLCNYLDQASREGWEFVSMLSLLVQQQAVLTTLGPAQGPQTVLILILRRPQPEMGGRLSGLPVNGAAKSLSDPPSEPADSIPSTLSFDAAGFPSQEPRPDGG